LRDTNYKPAALVDPADVAQVVTYAELKNARNAYLVYPQEQKDQLFNGSVGAIKVIAVGFTIESNLG
jgi:hypothetical protein